MGIGSLSASVCVSDSGRVCSAVIAFVESDGPGVSASPLQDASTSREVRVQKIRIFFIKASEDVYNKSITVSFPVVKPKGENRACSTDREQK